MFRRLSLIVVVAIGVAIGGVYTSGAPAAEAISSDCQNILNGFFPAVPVPNFGLFPATVDAGEAVIVSNVVLSGSGTHELVVNGSVAVGPVPLSTPLTYQFPTSGFYSIVHNLYGGPAVVDITWSCAAPGCDTLVSFPSTAVGGLFVADAPVYWAPGEMVDPAVTIGAGNTTRVIGQDSSGGFYKIVWECQLLWVPANTLGPNPDAVWNGAPLPTDVVE